MASLRLSALFMNAGDEQVLVLAHYTSPSAEKQQRHKCHHHLVLLSIQLHRRSTSPGESKPSNKVQT
jgi:hypothetical protein